MDFCYKKKINKKNITSSLSEVQSEAAHVPQLFEVLSQASQ